jgi:hypothetical protein
MKVLLRCLVSTGRPFLSCNAPRTMRATGMTTTLPRNARFSRKVMRHTCVSLRGALASQLLLGRAARPHLDIVPSQAPHRVVQTLAIPPHLGGSVRAALAVRRALQATKGTIKTERPL